MACINASELLTRGYLRKSDITSIRNWRIYIRLRLGGLMSRHISSVITIILIWFKKFNVHNFPYLFYNKQQFTSLL